jgi:hypothetical protein
MNTGASNPICCATSEDFMQSACRQAVNDQSFQQSLSLGRPLARHIEPSLRDDGTRRRVALSVRNAWVTEVPT